MILIIINVTVDRNEVISYVFYILCVIVIFCHNYMFVFILIQLSSCHV